MLRTPPPVLRHAVGAVKLGVAVTLAVLTVGPMLTTQVPQASASDVQGPTASDIRAQAELDTLMTEHGCSTTGLGADVIPGSALIERDDRVQHVSFDDGWAVFTGDAAGALLAVCRGGLR